MAAAGRTAEPAAARGYWTSCVCLRSTVWCRGLGDEQLCLEALDHPAQAAVLQRIKRAWGVCRILRNFWHMGQLQRTRPFPRLSHGSHAALPTGLPPCAGAAFLAAAAISSTAGDSSSSSEAATAAAAWALNPLVALGAVGMGVSLVQIHIYMTPVKRTLQVGAAL